MRTAILSMLLALQATPFTSHAQVPHRYGYLINATNEMGKVVGQSRAPDRAALLNVTSQACTVLARLLDDKNFHKDVNEAMARSQPTRQARASLKRELDQFASAFLLVEEKWLLEAGLKPAVARQILWSAATFQREIDAVVDNEPLMHSVGKLKQDVCDGANRLQKEEDAAKRWAMVRKWSYRIGGVSLIVVDLPLTTTPAGVGSVAIGAAITAWNE